MQGVGPGVRFPTPPPIAVLRYRLYPSRRVSSQYKVVSKETSMSINTRKEGNPVVGIVGGSTSDFPILQKAVDLLDDLEVKSELRVVSSHNYFFRWHPALYSIY